MRRRSSSCDIVTLGLRSIRVKTFDDGGLVCFFYEVEGPLYSVAKKSIDIEKECNSPLHRDPKTNERRKFYKRLANYFTVK